jgi:hypothetical protein
MRAQGTKGMTLDPILARSPVFSDKIDRLMQMIWELEGGRKVLFANSESFKVMAEDELEVELLKILEDLKNTKNVDSV